LNSDWSEVWVEIVAAFLKGTRRAKFLASVEVLNESVLKGSWVTRGRSKAQSGFYQGLTRKKEQHPNFQVHMCLTYGQALSPQVWAEFGDKLTTVEAAWARLCGQYEIACKELDAARPLPVLTAIKLSPKVTKTLIECNLDLDLSTIRVADMDFYEVPKKDQYGETVLTFDGKPVMERVYYVKWTPGIKHGKSRFTGFGKCEACGKNIPSRRYVPVEAVCKNNGLVSLHLGCDCAANIFGVKDVGVELDR
ncbi:MAG: hypothetical protein Q8P12_00385, partial [bacterium]|nr:hypothetical protein [bacterium]